MRDLDDQTQIRADHQGTRFFVALLDAGRQRDLVLRGQERDLTDLAQVDFDSSIAVFDTHIE